VVEYGKFWPLKIYVDREEVCTFYVYRNLEDAPVRDCTVELVKEPVEVYGTVAENINSLFVPDRPGTGKCLYRRREDR